MRHRLGLATRTQISVCKSPFPSAGTAVSLFRAKKVQERPLLPRDVKILTYGNVFYFSVRVSSSLVGDPGLICVPSSIGCDGTVSQ